MKSGYICISVLSSLISSNPVFRINCDLFLILLFTPNQNQSLVCTCSVNIDQITYIFNHNLTMLLCTDSFGSFVILSNRWARL